MGLIMELMDREHQRKRREELAKFVTDVEGAGSRERALDVVRNYSPRFADVKDFDLAFKTVDQYYPETSKEVKSVTYFDEKTGQPTTTFMSSQEAMALSDPAEVKRRFGESATLTKPDLETFYSQPDEKGRVQILGKLPVSQRPEGSVTLPELTEARRARAEELAQKRFEFSQERFEAWFGLAESRWAKALEKIAGKTEDDDIKLGRQFINDAARLTALSLNGRVLPDGSFQFDDDNRAAIFNDRLRYIGNLMEVSPKLKPNMGIFLSTEAAKAYPLTSELPKPPETKPAPKPKKPGLLSRTVEAVTGGGGEPAKPAAKKPAAEAGDPQQQVAAKGKEISERADLTPEQKQAALARLRDIARKNNLKVDF